MKPAGDDFRGFDAAAQALRRAAPAEFDRLTAAIEAWSATYVMRVVGMAPAELPAFQGRVQAIAAICGRLRAAAGEREQL